MIKTRFSPSPTGLIHLGNVRAALFSALYAAKNKGVFLLRIEDTDSARSDIQYVESLQDDLHWLGVNWQEGPGVDGAHAPYFQSQRHHIYNQYYQLLETQKLAYPCFCTEHELILSRKIQLSRGQAPRYSGTCLKLTVEEIEKKILQGLKPALRFKIPSQTVIEFVDTVKGPQRFNSDDIGDFIIRRADGSSSFMFCNAIDDSLMGVTHVLRGEDHLTNTPRQLMILKALNLRMPLYGHLSLITGDDGAPLSKRHGSSSLRDLREQGFLPQAVLNYMTRLGHSYDSQALMSFSELAEHFQLEKLSRSPARFDQNQLMFWQKHVLMSLDDTSLLRWLGAGIAQMIDVNHQKLFLDVVRQNALFPQEGVKWAKIFFEDDLEYSDDNKKILAAAGESFFSEWLKVLDQTDDLKQVLDILKNKLNIAGKNLFLPIRIALTGQSHGPELVQIVTLLGKKKIEQRILKVSAINSA